MKELALTEQTAIEAFTGNGLDGLIDQIKEESNIVEDATTSKGRKALRSAAAKVASSKVLIVKAGQSLTKKWKEDAKLVDASIRKAKTELDELRDEIKRPAVEWDAEQERIKLEQELLAEFNLAYDQAMSENNLFDREFAISEKERIATEEAEQKKLAEIKAKQEQAIKDQAAQKAKAQAEREAQHKIDEAKRVEAEAVANSERLKREAIEAKQKAKREAVQVEANRLQAIEDAKLKQEQAVFKAKEDARIKAEQAEQARLEKEATLKREAELLSADKEHRKKINNIVLKVLMAEGVDEIAAKHIMMIILKSKSKEITINY